ncbi:MAG TPA: YihY/virulence factor BrkB family protein [Flavisolibacter sp.]|jgi:membrane protein|nr:YihY/virulence factor BrkB family protein [Flavisolibacter sp.]
MKRAARQRAPFSFAVFLFLLKQGYQRLSQNDPLRMAGATAFFTSFAFPFILIILSQILSLFLDKAQARQDLYQTLGEILGYATMEQVIDILQAFRELANNRFITAFGILFLLLVSTTLLMVVKGSMNQLWGIRIVPGRGLVQKLRTRLRSLLTIAGTGILFVFSILAEGLKAYLDSTIISVAPAFATYFAGFLNYVFSTVFVTCWFALIFRILPDAKAAWRVAFAGALVTGILFNVGKYVLRLLLVNSDLNTLYGASASIVLLLLFVFYTSLIMYFGVAFTVVWSEYWRIPIRPMRYATHYKVAPVEETL